MKKTASWTFFGITPWRIFLLSQFVALYTCFEVFKFGIWGFIWFFPVGYLISLLVDVVFEFILFPTLNRIFNKSYGYSRKK